MVKLTTKDIKHDIKVLISETKNLYEALDDELRNNDITLLDCLVALRDNAEYNVSQFRELISISEKS